MEEPTVKEKMHVVVFVLDGSTLDVLSEGVVSKLKEIKSVVVDKSKYLMSEGLFQNHEDQSYIMD